MARHAGADFLEHADCRHDLAGLAVAALGHVQLAPGLLDPGADLKCAGALDGGDLGVADGFNRGHAGADERAVSVHGAGAALGDPAAVLAAGEP